MSKIYSNWNPFSILISRTIKNQVNNTKPHNRKISVIGLGYIGFSVAVAFGNQSQVIGFGIDHDRLEELKNDIDL